MQRKKAGASHDDPRVILVLTTKQGVIYPYLEAGIAQLVEHKLPKLGVAGSSPVARSIIGNKINSIFIRG
jgi:hypothetical protein